MSIISINVNVKELGPEATVVDGRRRLKVDEHGSTSELVRLLQLNERVHGVSFTLDVQAQLVWLTLHLALQVYYHGKL